MGSARVNQSGSQQYIVSIIAIGLSYKNEREECCSET